MQLKYQRNLIKAGNKLAKVTAIVWSPQVPTAVARMVVATADRILHIFDENGILRDSISTRPADKQQPNYIVKSLAFSPCGTMLACAQSDCIVYIYNLGSNWGDKKVICNKFPMTAPVNCLTWFRQHPIAGLSDGRIRECLLTSSMKSSSLYKYESSCLSIASSPLGDSLISGHSDGTIKIYRFNHADQKDRDFAKLDFPPVTLGWGADVVVAGLWKIKFFTESGKEAQTFDLSTESSYKPFQTLAFNPTGDCVVFGNFDKFISFSYKSGRKRGSCWDRENPILVPNLFMVSAITWKPDGSSLVLGSVTGAVDVFEVATKKIRHKSGLFEMSHVSASQCVVKVLATGVNHSIRAATGTELEKVDVINENFIVARSKETFIIKDMTTSDITEVLVGPAPPAPSYGASPLEIAAGREKVFLDHPGFVLIYTPGQILVSQCGKYEPLGMVRTEFATSDTTSVRVLLQNNSNLGGRSGTLVASLQDPDSFQIVLVETGEILGRMSHDCPLDFLELSPQGDKVIFRDYRKHLHLYDLQTKEKTTFLSLCSYAQWVPDAEVVVAQSQNTISVWYTVNKENSENPFQIEVADGSDAEAVEREPGRTSVLLRAMDGTQIRILLDEALIAFREFSAKQDFSRAVELLAAAPKTPSIQASWRELAKIALIKGSLAAAEAALAQAGDFAGSRYVYKTRKLKEKKDALGVDGMRDPEVLSRLFILQKDFASAEAILINAGMADSAINLHKELGRWQDVLRLTEKSSALPQFRAQCIQDLLHQDHLDLAAEVYEKDGQILKAVELYLRSGLAARAAALLANSPSVANASICQEVANKLQAAGLHDKAGELFERQGNFFAALESYRKGRVFRRALDLARQHNPHRIADITMEWAAWMRSQGDVEGACARYVEAGAYSHAIETALTARMWLRAEKLLMKYAPPSADSAEDRVYSPLFAQLAEHYRSCKQASDAARLFVRAGQPAAAVHSYLDVCDFERALEVARSCLSETEVQEKFETLARKLETENNLAESESLWLAIGNVDAAIMMYKNRGHFDHMISLIRKHYPDHLVSALQGLAQVKHKQGDLEQAERYYVDGGLWKDAVGMYREEDRWQDAIRVTQQHGKRNDSKKLYEDRALSIMASSAVDGGSLKAACQMLQDHGENDLCIDFMLKNSAFDEAVALARDRVNSRSMECYEKRALWHEEEGRYRHAEEDYILARKPQEAIEMHLHRQDYERALNLAERHDPSRKEEILAKRNSRMGMGGVGANVVPTHMQAHEQQKTMQEQLRQQQRQQMAQMQQKQALLEQQQAQASPAPGNNSEIADRLEELVHLGQWNECLELAAAKVPEAISHYINIFCKAVLRGHAHPRDAAEAIAKFAAASPKGLDNAEMILTTLGMAILYGGMLDSQEGRLGAETLKKAAQKVVLANTGSRSQGAVVSIKEFSSRAATICGGASHNNVLARLTLASHLCCQIFSTSAAADKAKARGDNHTESQLRMAIAWQGASLMRYSDMVTAEWVFFKAGDIARRTCTQANTKSQTANLQGLAFVAYNRAVDITDLIQEGREDNFGDYLDNTDFAESAIDVPPPAKLRPSTATGLNGSTGRSSVISPELMGEVRDIVLSWAIDSSVERDLPFRRCEGCANNKIFLASLECGSCKTRCEPCCVTGLPVVSAASRVECPACHSAANSADWDAYVGETRKCPWCCSDV